MEFKSEMVLKAKYLKLNKWKVLKEGKCLVFHEVSSLFGGQQINNDERRQVVSI